MIKQVMVLGATGNFGSKIARGLAKANIPLIITGRQEKNLLALKYDIQRQYPALSLQVIVFDIKNEISDQLIILKPFVVINTCGPFQSADYSIASECIKHGIHYIDLADSRNFVNGFCDKLDSLAKKNNSFAVTGASTVPCLSSAVLENYKNEFNSMESLVFGITPGQRTERGLATVQSILSYIGKPLSPYPGSDKSYGWQNLYRQTYPKLGKRWMAHCDIPDLDLLPRYYGLKFIQFSAGIESTFLHLSIWTMSWLIRLGLPINLANYAKALLKLSRLFDYFGTSDGGMHMIITGEDKSGNQKTIKWFIVAKNGHGPHIPTIPAIILAKKLVQDEINRIGAMPCVGLITLEEYLTELRDLDVHVYIDNNQM